MGLMTDKDKTVPRIHMNLLTVSTSRDENLNISVSGLLLSLPTYILFFFFLPEKWTMRNALAVYQMKHLCTCFVPLAY